ncbi:hypothetical protein C0991_001797 [Blastosporella zonata]|nr:hypothetical protein C0991_001797 [Blastosporella zonata]
MRAILIKDDKGPVENLHLSEAPTPSPGPGQVLVKIKAFGLNRMDISQREGHYPPPAGSSSILGVEFSGHISALGADVSGWKVDDEVLGLAGGALVLCAELKKGDNVLVHAGASGVGVAAIQLARFLGANTVTATASSKEKLDWLLSVPLGATHVANYKTEDFSEIVKKATNNKGADVVVDFVGKSHWKRNIDSLAIDGHMTMLALLSGKIHRRKLIFGLIAWQAHRLTRTSRLFYTNGFAFKVLLFGRALLHIKPT